VKFSCEKTLLQTAVMISSRAAAAKSSIPSLEGLLLETSGSDVRISGYDLKTGIVTSVPADIEEPGEIILNSRLFSEIIRKLPDDVVVVHVNENQMADITCGTSRFSIIGMPAHDYPELPTVDYQSSLYITQETLKAVIGQTNFAISTNEARPIHTGSLFQVEDNTLTVVSVDGYRLALRREPLNRTEIESCSFVVPGAALSEVEKISGDVDDLVKISVGSKHILFTIGRTMLISRRLEGEFLDYKNAIPKTGKYSIEVDKRAMIDSVERVSLIISDKLKSPVRCVFEDNLLKMEASTPLGRASDTCPVAGDGEGLEIGFNNRYILDALKAAPAETLRLQLSTGISPCIIVPADENRNFLYMVLPVRLKANEG